MKLKHRRKNGHSDYKLPYDSTSNSSKVAQSTSLLRTNSVVMATERFVISALEASFMKDHDLLGKQDPYVVFELGSEKITTPAIKSGGTNCSWEESFTLIGRNSASDLQATVYNKNTLRLVDDMLMAFAAFENYGSVVC